MQEAEPVEQQWGDKVDPSPSQVHCQALPCRRKSVVKSVLSTNSIRYEKTSRNCPDITILNSPFASLCFFAFLSFWLVCIPLSFQILKCQWFLKVFYRFLKIIYQFLRAFYRFLKVISTIGRDEFHFLLPSLFGLETTFMCYREKHVVLHGGSWVEALYPPWGHPAVWKGFQKKYKTHSWHF